jgi:hypothetical protein
MVLKATVDRLMTSVAKRAKPLRITRNATGWVTFIRNRGLQLSYITIIFIFSAGTVNAILEGSRQAAGGIPILPTRLAQTIAESMINVSAIAIGMIGFYLVFTGGRQALRGRVATAFVMGGLLLVSISVLIGFSILGLKGF